MWLSLVTWNPHKCIPYHGPQPFDEICELCGVLSDGHLRWTPEFRQPAKVQASTVTSNVAANINVRTDIALNCIMVDATLPPANSACFKEPETVFRGLVPELQFNQRCIAVTTKVSIKVDYLVREAYSVYMHWSSPPDLRSKAEQAAAELNKLVGDRGYKTFRPDSPPYVGKRPGFPRRLVVFYWDSDRRAAQNVADIANAWLKTSRMGGSSFNVSDQTSLAANESPRGHISLELWLDSDH
jgi:hypothetical protein